MRADRLRLKQVLLNLLSNAVKYNRPGGTVHVAADGCQVLARLRANPATRPVPVVAVTAQAMPEDVKRVLAADFDGCLAKPLDLASFDELLERMLAPRDETG